MKTDPCSPITRRSCFRAIVLFAALVCPLAAQTGTSSSRPVAFGLVIDNSSSLRRYFSEVTAVAKALVESKEPADQVFVTRFVDRENITIVQEFTGDKKTLLGAIEAMKIEGGQTALLDAVYRSTEHLLSNQNGDELARPARALVLITDGGDGASYYKPEPVLNLLRQKNVKVYVIGFPEALKFQGKRFEDEAIKTIKMLTDASGGKSYFPATEEEAKSDAAEILKEIRML